MHYVSHYESPLGAMTMASDGEHLTGLWFDGQKYDRSTINDEAALEPDLPVFKRTAQWLDAYFGGTDPGFTPPIRVEGSDFKRMVTSIMLSIPFGATSTYARIAAEVARRTGRKQMSAQAVGGAVGRNPIVLIVPCHRVLASDGSLRGYAGGVDRKEWLLKMEGVNMSGLSTPPDADDGGERREWEGRPLPRAGPGESRRSTREEDAASPTACRSPRAVLRARRWPPRSTRRSSERSMLSPRIHTASRDM